MATKNVERSLFVYPPVYRLGSIGKQIRSFLMSGIIQGTPVLLQIQACRFHILTEFMKSVSFLGEEEFYALLLTSSAWIFCGQLGRMLAFVMSICFYCTGFLKNSLCLPRPPVPPVVPMARCSDWGFPSHHSVLNVAVPWYIWIYVYLHCDWPSQALGVLLFLVGAWSFSIMFSRLYLGVHSPADILCGGIMGCIILTFWLQIYESVERNLVSGQFILSLLAAALFGFSILPDPRPHSIIFVETIDCIGPSLGFNLAYYVSSVLKIKCLALFETDYVLAKLWYQIPARLLLGGASVLLVKFVLERVTAFLLISILSLFGLQSSRVKRRSALPSEKVHYSQSFHVLDKVINTIECLLTLKITLFLKLDNVSIVIESCESVLLAKIKFTKAIFCMW